MDGTARESYGRPAPHTASARSGNYTRKVVPSRIGHELLTLKPYMIINLTDSLNSLARLFAAVRAVLNAQAGITVFMATQYQNYARQLWYAKRAHTGDQFINEAKAIIIDWSQRGLDFGGADRPGWSIATTIFGVPCPIS